MLPIDTNTREWIDAKCSWIVNQVGLDRVLSSKVIAADAELLEGYRPDDEDSVYTLFRKICIAMDIEFKSIHFYFMNNEGKVGGNYAVGLYQPLDDGTHAITIDRALLESPVDLIATLAHELCHVLLIGHHWITGDEDDHEPLTDLLTVFLGFGALSGNSVLRDESWYEGNASRWQIRRAGYLTMTMYGYALAVFATLRNESPQTWKPRLRLDVRNAFMKSIMYFQQHGLPDLSKVISTDARPALHFEESSKREPPPKRSLRHGCYDDEDDVDEEFREEVDYQYCESTEDDDEEAATGTADSCVYCGAPALRIDPLPLCVECLGSITENETELEQQGTQGSSGFPMFVVWFFVLGGAIIALIFVIAALL